MPRQWITSWFVTRSSTIRISWKANLSQCQSSVFSKISSITSQVFWLSLWQEVAAIFVSLHCCLPCLNSGWHALIRRREFHRRDSAYNNSEALLFITDSSISHVIKPLLHHLMIKFVTVFFHFYALNQLSMVVGDLGGIFSSRQFSYKPTKKDLFVVPHDWFLA